MIIQKTTLTKTTNLFLFLVIATILITSSLASGSVFADKDSDKKSKDTDKKGKDEKNDNNPFKGLWDAIAFLQAQIDAGPKVFPKTYDVTKQVDVRRGTTGVVTAMCDVGDHLKVGGYSLSNYPPDPPPPNYEQTDFDGWTVAQNLPFRIANQDGWTVLAENNGNQGLGTITAYVECYDFAPLRP